MMPNTIEELEQVRKECRAMVARRAALAGGAAVVPVPGLDAAADVTLLMRLIPAINRKFGLSQEQIDQLDTLTKTTLLEMIKLAGKQLIGSAITKRLVMKVARKAGAKIAAKSTLKFVPLVGQVAAATIGFAAMKTIGNRHVDDCYRIVKDILEQRPASTG